MADPMSMGDVEEDPFDLSLKKKKKKKKAPEFGEEAGDVAVEAAAEEPAAGADAADAAAAAAGAADAGLGDDLFDLSMKKKKKKKKTDGEALPGLEALDAAAADDAAAAEPAAAAAAAAPADEPAADDEDLDLSLASKKKKKKKAKVIADLSEEINLDAGADGAGGAGDVAAVVDTSDYTYAVLLERVFNTMRQRNPDMVAGEKRRFVMKPPQVVRIGTKKCAFVNFAEICKLLHRQADHVMGFVLAELGTSGSVDGSNALVLRGRFQQKQIETVLRHYIREYVTCHTCKAPDTILAKENRLFFLQCEKCGSKCSVASIKAGFVAVTGKRSALRAKEAS